MHAATPVAAVTNCRKRDHEHLREVRQPGLAAVVLQVRVGREARDRVERERRLHVADAVRIERQVLLERHDRPRRQPHEHVRDQAARTSTASSPAARSRSTPVRRSTSRSIGTSTGSSSVRCAGEHVEHVPAEQQARGDREQDRERDGEVFRAHGSLRTSPAAASRTPGTRRRRTTQEQATVSVMTAPTRDRTARRSRAIAANVARPEPPFPRSASSSLPLYQAPCLVAEPPHERRRAACSGGRADRRDGGR